VKGAPTLALLGLRGSGKSTVGRLVAARLEHPFLDLDALTVEAGRRAGRREGSAGELLAAAGIVAFRAFEAEALRRVLEPGLTVVLATGGGVLERPDNRAWLARAACRVWLRVPVEELQRRLRSDPTLRPPLLGHDPVEEVGALAARRQPLFRSESDLVVEAGDGTPEDVCERVLAALA